MAPRIDRIVAPPRPQCLAALVARRARPLATSRPRPTLPFLLVPKTPSPSPSSSSSHLVRRSFTSERRRWWRHEARLVARYTLTLWGVVACVGVIVFFLAEEMAEREFPTPHGWRYMTRKYLRDALGLREDNWARALELSRGVVIRLEDPRLEGQGGVSRLSEDAVDEALEVPTEFAACDISRMPEDWRRGYFEAIMLAAKAAEHVDGWLRDTTRNVVCPPEFVVGPSNPRPSPVPPGRPAAPREEHCEPAYPPADNWYIKILATKGLDPRQRVEAALEYASFLEFKNNPAAAEALLHLALAESSSSAGSSGSSGAYDPRSLALRDRAVPSANLLDALTAMATFRARRGDLPSALEIYLSLLKARRALPNEPPAATKTTSTTSSSSSSSSVPLLQRIAAFLAPPAYPPPPPDGSQPPPWRDALQRCHEASLSLYIGEILYATGSPTDGLAWTRDAVDQAEEQLRAGAAPASRQTCRECLSAGLGNWATMVRRLARQEELERARRGPAAARPALFSLWSGSEETEGRWAAEEAVVQERQRRTRELLEDIPVPGGGIQSFFKA